MNPSFRVLAACVLLGGAVVASGVPAASAQQPPAAVVAFVDVQWILSRSAAARDVQAQIEKQGQRYQAEHAAWEAELRAADQNLAGQRAILSSEAFAQKRRELQVRVAEAQRTAQRRKKGLDRAYAVGMGQVREAMVAVIGELARERGVNLVLVRGPILFADNSLNLSEEVLRRLNERVPSVTLPQAEN